LTDIKRDGSDGVYMFTAGGNYEASIILLDSLWTKENLPVKGDFVIAIPSRDVLMITGSNDKAGINEAKRTRQKDLRPGNYPISPYLYNGTAAGSLSWIDTVYSIGPPATE